MPATPNRSIAFIMHPIAGAPGAPNTCAVACRRVKRVVFKILDAQKKRVGKAVIVLVDGGTASFNFKNPPAGRGYYVVAEDRAMELDAIASRTFHVTEGAVPVPPPPPVPVPPGPQPVPVPPGPTPPPIPTPQPPAPAILAVDGDMANAEPGKPVRLTIRAVGMPAVEWVAVRGDERSTWRTEPARLDLSQTGEATLDFTPEPGDLLVKVMQVGNRSIAKDSARMPAAPAPQPPVPPMPDSDAAFAHAWRDSLLQGVNIERWRGCYMTFRGQRLSSGTAYYEYLKAAGITHVRWFFPWHNDADMLGDGVTLRSGQRPSLDKIREWLGPVKLAARAGLKNHLDFVDVASWDVLRDQWANVQAHIADCSRLVAESAELGPENTMVGPYNELIRWQSTNAQYNGLRMDAHAVIRNILPKHIICHGSDDWDNWPALTANDWQAPPDKRSMGQWHGYVGADIGQGGLREIQAAMDDFERRHGIPTYCGEFGDDFGHSHVGNDDRWVRLMNDCGHACPRAKPAWWAITDGSEFPLNDRDDAAVRPQLYDAFRAAAPLFKTA